MTIGNLAGCVRNGDNWAGEIIVLMHNSIRVSLRDMSEAMSRMNVNRATTTQADMSAFFSYWTVFRLFFKAYMDILQDYFMPLLQARRVLPEDYRRSSDMIVVLVDKLRDFCMLEKSVSSEKPEVLLDMSVSQFQNVASKVLEVVEFQEKELPKLMLQCYNEGDGKLFVNAVFQRLNEDMFSEELLSMTLRWMTKEARTKWMKKHLPLQSRLLYELTWKGHFEKRYVAPLLKVVR